MRMTSFSLNFDFSGSALILLISMQFAADQVTCYFLLWLFTVNAIVEFVILLGTSLPRILHRER